MPALAIRHDLPAAALRRLARQEPDRRAAMRLLAIAHALDGFSRAEAARLAGTGRQAVRDAVLRYNAQGPGGLRDRPRSGRPEALTPGQQAALEAWALRGPNPERDEVSAWSTPAPMPSRPTASATAAGACRACCAGSGSRARRRGLGTRRAARPSGRERRSRPFETGAWVEVAEARPGVRVRLWRQDEARVGQKGRVCHRWYERGVRPPGLADQRFVREPLPVRRLSARHRPSLRPCLARGDHGGHGPVARRVRRAARARRPRRADPGPGGLAWLAAPHRAGEHHAAAAAGLLARARPGRAGPALPARTLPLASRARRLQGRARCCLRRLERPRRGDRQAHQSHRLPLSAQTRTSVSWYHRSRPAICPRARRDRPPDAAGLRHWDAFPPRSGRRAAWRSPACPPPVGGPAGSTSRPGPAKAALCRHG